MGDGHPTEEPFADQHQRLVTAARRHGLDPAPLGGGKLYKVYEAGLEEAARRLDIPVGKLRVVAPAIEEVLP